MIAYVIIRSTLYQERDAAREAINKGRDTRVFQRKKCVIKNKMDIIVCQLSPKHLQKRGGIGDIVAHLPLCGHTDFILADRSFSAWLLHSLVSIHAL